MADEDLDLGAIIASEIRQAESYDKTELAGKRTRAIEYMRGEMNDTAPRPNGSKQTDRTFADTVSWILPGVVSVFAASNKFVQYSKVKSETDDWARDATDFTNHSFWSEGNGYAVIYDVIYDALTMGNGVISSYWEPERTQTKIFRNKTEMEIAALMEEGWQPVGIEAKPGKPRSEPVEDPMTGEDIEQEVPTWTVKLGKALKPGKICDKACKPENLLLNTTATTIEDARFVAYYHDDKTRSDLMEMAADYGWDKARIEALPSHSRISDNEVTSARDASRQINIANSPTKAGDYVGLYECYIRVDKDGDGIAELVQAWWAGDVGGGALLGDEEFEEDIPYSDIRCYPVPHRYDADSVFDRTEDIQRVNTVLLRGILDNSYAVSLPMFEAEAGTIDNPDILASPRFGATIWRTKGKAQVPMVRHEFPFVADKLLLAKQNMDEMTSKRTGVSRTTMALDPEALQNQSATAARQNRDAGYSQIELIARNCAQYGGFTKHFAKRIKLAINHQQVREIPDQKAENGFRQIDPSQWDPNMAVVVNTGLGTGSRDRDMAMLNTIKQGQIVMAQMLGAAGLQAKALEFLPKIRKTAVQEAESSGLRNPEEYYPEVTDEEVDGFKQQMAEKAQQPPMEMQLEQMKGQNAEKLKQVDAQVSMHEAEIKARGDVVKNKAELEADLMTSEAERKKDLELEEIRQQHEDRRFFAKLAQERELAVMQMSVTEVESEEGGDKPEGKAGAGKPRQRTRRRVVESMGPRQNEIVAGFGSLAQAVQSLAARMERIEQTNMAEVEIIRGADGKATGARKRMAMN